MRWLILRFCVFRPLRIAVSLTVISLPPRIGVIKVISLLASVWSLLLALSVSLSVPASVTVSASASMSMSTSVATYNASTSISDKHTDSIIIAPTT